MAFSYLTDAQRSNIASIFENIAATFDREIYVFADGERVSIASNPEFNSFYRTQSANTQFETVSHTIRARIKYVKADEELFSAKNGAARDNNQSKVALPAGSVKIKVDAAGHELMKNARRVELDGNRFAIVSNARQIAMFGPDYSPYYEYLLTPTDEQ